MYRKKRIKRAAHKLVQAEKQPLTLSAEKYSDDTQLELKEHIKDGFLALIESKKMQNKRSRTK